MKINGYEIEVDFTDADFVEKIEKKIKKMIKRRYIKRKHNI